MTDFLFFLFSAMAVLSAIFMVMQSNPVASVLYLVVTFFSLSGLFVILDAHFIAAVQVIVYAGAIMVLFLFVIMLLNLGSAEVGDLRRGLSQLLAGSVAVALVAVFARLFLVETDPAVPEASALDPLLEAQGAVAAVAEPLFTRYLVAFEVTSVLLLVAVVGAVVLARRRAP
ncbi:MAG: NADH-quinone oxidoreductase subunit J [Gemmatimonadota bacterium]|jgi:NADH-quinone oxidoreductase subunit J|nr:MAG: NADH-quinone oxidoreductase subunit J [Gemmatimonadota bacterium]